MRSDLLESASGRARPKHADDQEDQHHCGRDKYEHAGHAVAGEHEGDDVAGEDGAESAPGIDKADRLCADPGWVEFGLVGVEE